MRPRKAEGKRSPKRLTEEQRAKRRASERRYAAKNRERRRAENRQYKKDHPEKIREYKRKYRQRMKETNPEKLHALDQGNYQRQSTRPGYTAKRTASARQRRAANPAVREQQRAAGRRFAHGPDYPEVFTRMWNEQGGCCYLCGEPLVQGRDTHIDHDHSCCPAGRSCSYCRRGLACNRCNRVIGAAADDPALLRLIVSNLEPVFTATRMRIAGKPEQPQLWSETHLV